MTQHHTSPVVDAQDGSTGSRAAAWLVFALAFLLMVMDYVDRQIVVSMFPYLKAEFDLSDKQLGSLVSVVGLMVGIGALPLSLVVDRWSRTKGIVVMGVIWSLATMACGVAQSYAQLLIARGWIGAGEAAYGPAAGALLSTRFPQRMRGFILGLFLSAAGVGSILGVVLGGVIAARWGWHAAFGIVGVPGLAIALAFWFVPDYQTVKLDTPSGHGGKREPRATLWAILRSMIAALLKPRTAIYVYLGGAMQGMVVATMLTWLPTFFNRMHKVPVPQAGLLAAGVIIVILTGAVVWGHVLDRIGLRTRKLYVLAALCIVSQILVSVTFGLLTPGPLQLAMIVVSGFVMSCSTGASIAIAVDITHMGARASSVGLSALVQNLLGQAVAPILVGGLSDAFSLELALTLISVTSTISAALFFKAAASYASDARMAEEAPLI